MRSSKTTPPPSARTRRRASAVSTALLLAAGLTWGCTDDIRYEYPRSGPGGKPTYEKQESLFGEDGLKLFGDDSKDPAAGQGAGIGVNSFLWRASLDTVSFMPLASADPFGGVIITDWYSPPDAPAERFKVNIFILDRALRSDGIRAKIFKQTRAGDGWTDAQVDEGLDVQLENAILTRARQLRINSASR